MVAVFKKFSKKFLICTKIRRDESG